jgi:hypothetical protein
MVINRIYSFIWPPNRGNFFSSLLQLLNVDKLGVDETNIKLDDKETTVSIRFFYKDRRTIVMVSSKIIVRRTLAF